MSTVITKTGQITLPDTPLTCPSCGVLIMPVFHFAVNGKHELEVFTQCRNSDCKQTYISVFEYTGSSYNWMHYKPLPLLKKSFSEVIHNISPAFIDIYNQAYAAEQMGLDSICGVGYRKALEFLVKDFAIKEKSEEEDKIKRMPLQQCITSFIENAHVKPIVERAVWLGNDETHYVRKFESKDVKDLKGLISLSVYWIQAEIQSRTVLEEMQ